MYKIKIVFLALCCLINSRGFSSNKNPLMKNHRCHISLVNAFNEYQLGHTFLFSEAKGDRRLQIKNKNLWNAYDVLYVAYLADVKKVLNQSKNDKNLLIKSFAALEDVLQNVMNSKRHLKLLEDIEILKYETNQAKLFYSGFKTKPFHQLCKNSKYLPNSPVAKFNVKLSQTLTEVEALNVRLKKMKGFYENLFRSTHEAAVFSLKSALSKKSVKEIDAVLEDFYGMTRDRKLIESIFDVMWNGDQKQDYACKIAYDRTSCIKETSLYKVQLERALIKANKISDAFTKQDNVRIIRNKIEAQIKLLRVYVESRTFFPKKRMRFAKRYKASADEDCRKLAESYLGLATMPDIDQTAKDQLFHSLRKECEK